MDGNMEEDSEGDNIEDSDEDDIEDLDEDSDEDDIEDLDEDSDEDDTEDSEGDDTEDSEGDDTEDSEGDDIEDSDIDDTKLVFHGLGTGKTTTSINIDESFRDQELFPHIKYSGEDLDEIYNFNLTKFTLVRAGNFNDRCKYLKKLLEEKSLPLKQLFGLALAYGSFEIIKEFEGYIKDNDISVDMFLQYCYYNGSFQIFRFIFEINNPSINLRTMMTCLYVRYIHRLYKPTTLKEQLIRENRKLIFNYLCVKNPRIMTNIYREISLDMLDEKQYCPWLKLLFENDYVKLPLSLKEYLGLMYDISECDDVFSLANIRKDIPIIYYNNLSEDKSLKHIDIIMNPTLIFDMEERKKYSIFFPSEV